MSIEDALARRRAAASEGGGIEAALARRKALRARMSGEPSNAFDNPEARAWLADVAGDIDVRDSSTMDERMLDYAATVGPPAAALAAGVAMPALGAVGTLGTGLLLGGATRGTSAAMRGEDVSDAVLDPSSIGLDAALSGIPAVAATAKYGVSKLPDVARVPIENATRRVGQMISDGVSRAAHAVAKRQPRYGAKLVDDSWGLTLDDALSGRPPIMEPDYSSLATKPVPGRPAPQRASGLEAFSERFWQGEIRGLESSRDPVARSLAAMVRRRNNVEDALHPALVDKVDEALSAISQGDESVAVARALDTGSGLNVEAQGLPGAPEIAAKARPIREALQDVGEMRSGRVWDLVKKKRKEFLEERGLPVVEPSKGQFYAEAQPIRTGFYPRKEIAGGDEIAGMSDLERVALRNPDMTAKQLQRQLRRTAKGKTVGYSRDGGMEDFSLSVHDVIPQYVKGELPRIANAEAFGGEPMRIRLQDGRDVLVGKKAGLMYNDLINRGRWKEARQASNALGTTYAPKTGYENDMLRAAARGTSNMALSHSAFTQLGQAHTPIWASGGPTQMARGKAMVDENPLLRDIFKAAQRTDFSDYNVLARGGDKPVSGGLAGPMDMMEGIEDWLRGPDSYAAVPFIDDIVQEAKAVREAGGEYSGALLKRAQEAGLDLDYLVDEVSTNGTLSPGTWMEGIQNLVRRWQYSTAPGEIPSKLRDPVGALIALYKTYGIKASQHITDDILKPLLSSDPSLRKLGWKRLRDAGLYGIPSNAATSVIRSATRGRLPGWSNVIQQSITGPTGIVGDAAYRTVDAFTPEYGEDPLQSLADVPTTSIPLGILEDVAGAGKDPGRAVAAMIKGAGLIDPRIPLYGTAPVNILREATR